MRTMVEGEGVMANEEMLLERNELSLASVNVDKSTEVAGTWNACTRINFGHDPIGWGALRDNLSFLPSLPISLPFDTMAFSPHAIRTTGYVFS